VETGQDLEADETVGEVRMIGVGEISYLVSRTCYPLAPGDTKYLFQFNSNKMGWDGMLGDP
jgi:hypothetical protein